MERSLELSVFRAIVTAVSMCWGRVNRIGYSNVVTEMVRVVMNYSRMNAELIRCYIVWVIYLALGAATSILLLTIFKINFLRYLTLGPASLPLIPLAFIAQNSLTGLLMQTVIAVKPGADIFSELANVIWVRYTLTMPGVMRMVSPLCAAMVEELFFRGTVFLILINHLPETGVLFAIVACTALFIVQQVLQTDTVGQGLIFIIGSTSISIVGYMITLYTQSFLSTLLCHAAYAVLYLQLGTSMPKSGLRSQRKPTSAYSNF